MEDFGFRPLVLLVFLILAAQERPGGVILSPLHYPVKVVYQCEICRVLFAPDSV